MGRPPSARVSDMKASDFIVEGYREAGRVNVKSALTPISLQARRERLSDLKVALKEAIATSTDFLMTHDVEVTLTWYVTEADRYQSHTKCVRVGGAKRTSS